jgi:predicted Zn-dependent protease with MMP-like domain
MTVSDRQDIIMNFGKAPSLDDVLMLAKNVMNSLPDELTEQAIDLEIDVQDFPDELVEIEQKLDDPYDLLALYKSAKELSPGVEKKAAEGNDALILYRRSILDYWCENGEQFEVALRQIMIEEIAGQGDFNDDEIDEMVSRHHQGIL